MAKLILHDWYLTRQQKQASCIISRYRQSLPDDRQRCWIVNDVDVVDADHDMPKLTVARALWIPQPNLKVGAAAWIYAGSAHHTGFSQALTWEPIADYSDIAGIEFVCIHDETTIYNFKNELRWNEVAHLLSQHL